MRANIDIDDALIAEAMKVTGLATKRATVEEALRLLVRRSRQKQAISNMAGLGWDGDLDASRTFSTLDGMILVDSSVWIANVRDTPSPPVRKFRSIENTEDILVGDLILLEVFRGARDDAHAARIEREMRQFTV